MKKKLSKISIFVVVVALGIGAYAGKLNAIAANANITDAKSEKTNLENKKQETEKMLADLETKKGNVLEYIEELDKQLTSIETKIDTLAKQIADREYKLSETQEELEEAKAVELEQYEIMKKRIQYMYMNGNTKYLQIIMTANSMADLLNRSEYVKQISEYDRSMFERYQDAKNKVMNTESSIANKIIELNDLNEELLYEKSTLEELISKKNTELQKYNDGISKSEKEIADYEASIAKQEELIEDLLEKERLKAEAQAKAEAEQRRLEAARKALDSAKNNFGDASSSSSSSNSNSDNVSYSNSSSSASANISGKGFMWPVPASGRITCGFGYRNAPTAGASTYHKGIDIGASSGTSIVATASGKVIVSGYSGGEGNYIMLSHGNGVYSYYMHCSRLLVSVGQSVSRGQKIGLVGSTGISTGPHLHFAITVNGGYVNPRNYVSY